MLNQSLKVLRKNKKGCNYDECGCHEIILVVQHKQLCNVYSHNDILKHISVCTLYTSCNYIIYILYNYLISNLQKKYLKKLN